MLILLYLWDLNHFNVGLVMMEFNGFSLSTSWPFVAIHSEKMDGQKDGLNSHFFGKQGIIILENNNTDALNFDHSM